MTLIVIWLGWTPSTLTSRVQGARWGSGASAMHFGRNFVKQKLLGTPNLVCVGYLFRPQIRIWKDLAPVCFWCCGAPFTRGVYKMKVVVSVLNGYFLSIGHDHKDRVLACRAPEGNVWLSQHD